MTIRVGINGMGRIGREYLRYAVASDDIEIVALNDITDLARLVPLIRHDSTFGRFNKEVEAQGNTLIVDGRKIAVSALREPGQIPWAEHGAEIVIESTGKFRTRDQAGAHLAAGADHRVLPDRRRPQADLHDLRQREREEERHSDRDRQRHRQGDLVAGAGRLEQEQRAEDEADRARHSERAVAEREEELG